MAVAVDATGHGNNSTGSTTVSCSVTVGSGSNRYMTILVSIRGAQTVSGITVDGVAATQVASARANVTVASADRWYIKNPNSGTITVTATLSASAVAAIGVISFTGVDQTTPHGTAVAATGSSAAPSVTVTSATGEVVVGGFAQKASATTTTTAGTGQTKQWDEPNVNSTLNAADSTENGASSVVMDWSTGINSDSWAATGLSIKPAATTTIPRLTLLGVG